MTPEISVIIAMYNTEKYIGECLDSILLQTFQNYEVLIVDDCSTDKSCEVVESYMPAFNSGKNERLRLIHTKKNSGCCAIPRNVGLPHARGKYIYFVDSDDALTETALEALYTAAEDFQADIVHCERYYCVNDEDFTTDENLLTAFAWLKADFVDEPTLMTGDIKERIKIFADSKFDWSTCNNFIRRDFFIKQKISIPPLRVCEDMILGIYLICLAERIVCIPDVVYIYRRRGASLSQNSNVDAEKRIKCWGDLFFRGFAMLEKFFDERKIFQDEPQYKLGLLHFITEYQLMAICDLYAHVPVSRLDEIVRQELAQVEDKTPLTAFFFDYMNIATLNLIARKSNYEKLVRLLNEQKKFERYQSVQIQNLKSVIHREDVFPR